MKSTDILIKALNEISKETRTLEGDYTYNQMITSPTHGAYTAKQALIDYKKARKEEQQDERGEAVFNDRD